MWYTQLINNTMKTITLSIYSLQTKAIPKGEPKNWNKGGRLSKRALTAKGSYTVTLRDGEEHDTKASILGLISYGYENLHTGYIDSSLYMEKDGEQYIAFLTVKLSDNWPNPISVGFSNYLK